METINLKEYFKLKANQILKLSIEGQDEFLFVKNVNKRVLQAFQPAWTPIETYTLTVLKNFELSDFNFENENDFYYLEIEPEKIKEFELLECSVV